MSHRLVALDDVLRTLTEAGPLPTDALAHKLRLSKFDARLVLVDAHAHGLVSTNWRGEWMISELGREALEAELRDRPHAARAPQNRWGIPAYRQRLSASGVMSRWLEALNPRYLARRGLPLAMGAIVCAGGVAVASSRLESATQAPAIVSTHVKTHKHRQHTGAGGAQTVVLRHVTGTRHRTRSTLVARAPRVHRVAVPVVRQSHRRPQGQCGQRHQARGRRGRTTGACAGGRRGILRSGSGGART